MEFEEERGKCSSVRILSSRGVTAGNDFGVGVLGEFFQIILEDEGEGSVRTSDLESSLRQIIPW